MKTIVDSWIEEKRILILGFGREGKSTLKLCMESGLYKSLTVADDRDVRSELPAGVNYITASEFEDSPESFEVVFKTPGIVLKRALVDYRCRITGQTEVFMSAFKNNIIGITGTKGKSTTATLLYHVLSFNNVDSVLAGNIGIPVFDIAKDVKENTAVVLELSCHQLEYLLFSPKRAVILNLYEDHLDHYGTRERYIAAKKNIYLHQNEDDIFYTSAEASRETNSIKSHLRVVSETDAPFTDFSQVEGARLRGRHNILNAAFAYTIASEFGVTKEGFLKALGTYEPLKHRLELVCSINGIDYYDDSISTTVKSTMSAIESVPNARYLLLGGMERNIDYSELLGFIAMSRISTVICMYESGKRFYDMYTEYTSGMKYAPKAVCVNDLDGAVSLTKILAKPGDAVLLSPAAASYGYFKNFEERGDKFVELVKKQ